MKDDTSEEAEWESHQSRSAKQPDQKERRNLQREENSCGWGLPGSQKSCQEGCMMNLIITCPPKSIRKKVSGQMT